MHYGLKTRITVFIFLLWMGVSAAGNSPPILAVMDFENRGASQYTSRQLVDLFAYLLFESKAYIVIDRYERNKLLKAADLYTTRLHTKEGAIAAGNKLYANYVLTGVIKNNRTGWLLELDLFSVPHGDLHKTFTGQFNSVTEIITQSREICAALLPVSPPAPEAMAMDFLAYFTPPLITARTLFVLSQDSLSPEIAHLKTLLNLLVRHYTQNNELAVYFTELSYDLTAPDLDALSALCRRKSCHTFMLFTRDEEQFFLSLFDEQANRKLHLPVPHHEDMASGSEFFISQFESQRPPLAPGTIIREQAIARNLQDRVNNLLFNEQLTNQRYILNLHYKLTKEAVIQTYHAEFNLISLEVDGYWYYQNLLGVGLGYGYNLSYPGQVTGSNIVHHPLVHQQEFRLTPFSLRITGPITITTNLFTSINFHKVYKLTNDPGLINEREDFVDPYTLYYLKLGLNLGFIYNINKSFSAFIDTITFSGIFPLNLQLHYLDDDSRFYGSLGGLGIIYRF